MALLKHADAGHVVREAIVLDLGDLQRQADQLRAAARKEAERIVADARRERERLIADAAEVGRQEGFEKGLAQGRAEGLALGKTEAETIYSSQFSILANAWNSALDDFLSQRQRLIDEARRGVLRLALLIAECAVKRRIETDPSVVIDQVEAALAAISRPTRLMVYVNPEDMPLVAKVLPTMAERFAAAEHAELEADPSLSRGSCVVRTRDIPKAEVDASIDTQLRRLAEVLMPSDAPAPRSDPAEQRGTLPARGADPHDHPGADA